MSASADADASESHLPWVEKHRPSKLEELASHAEILKTLTKFVDEDRLPHLLFHGPPGTGKTTAIQAVARRIYGAKYKSMVLELNASDERGIGTVQNVIKEFASTKKIFSSGFKMIILDEADNMTSIAQFALRRIMEKYTQNTRFCLIGNYMNKIIPALQSRCTAFRFPPLKKEEMLTKLQAIADAEKVKLEEAGLTAIVTLSNGDMRSAVNLLQASALSNDFDVKELGVYRTAGAPSPSDVRTVLGTLMNGTFSQGRDILMKVVENNGIALRDIIEAFHSYLLRLALSSNALGFLLSKLSDIQETIAAGAHEKTAILATVGAFTVAKDLHVKSGQ
eukprot:CAMPEP_0113888048 /NCGR_PEP_ID=MMETSP0780_2-20120614/12610_1 /TAXON_ID=652834 /ORGANISM="Palpitomonas bilix" /LENGTH=335 /DNA_ID=CAMNT_0000876763 /DNA_START=29 /DNA_END=1036 /DNA_ORIENTATION=- /assembly_acc=CAM_ASM_000599